MIELGKTKMFMKSGNVSFLRAASRFKEHLYARLVQRLLGSSRLILHLKEILLHLFGIEFSGNMSCDLALFWHVFLFWSAIRYLS